MTTLHAPRTRARSRRLLGLTVAVASLAALSAGCELIVDFNRALIEGGVDASVFDAGDAGFDAGIDSGVDALVVPEAQADVVFVDSTSDAHSHMDAKVDSTVDATLDATSGDAHADVTTHDAQHDVVAHDAHADAVEHDAHADSKSDAPTDASHDGG